MKERIVVFSDSHGNVKGLKDCIEHALQSDKPYAAVFLGDGESDFEKLRIPLEKSGIRCYQAAGNNDFSGVYASEFTFTVNGIKIFACHGHHQRVRYSLDRLCYATMEVEAKVALYGHTHIPNIEFAEGICMVNPGAVADCSAGMVRYAELSIEDGGFAYPRLISEPLNR